MLLKIQLPQQEKKHINLPNGLTFVCEVIGSSTENLQQTAWIINPESLALSSSYSLEKSSLVKFLSLILVRKEDVFKLIVYSKTNWDDNCDTLDVISVEEVFGFPAI
jgi:hypothetical protein